MAECYFFAHLLAAVSHMPPAFSQSACVVYWLKSPDVELELGEGLADGDAPDPLGEADGDAPDPLGAVDAPPEVPPPDVVPPEPVAPDVPDGALEPVPPAAPLPLPPPEPVWAATIAGVSAITATSRAAKSFVMSRPPSV
ncbi:MAG TPA: hypothetical protein VIE36_11360 [Methylomirabilota bacterium]